MVNVTDVGGGLVPWAAYAAYCASKAALRAVTECLALELAPGVRVNAVAPGTVLWPERLRPARGAALAAASRCGGPATPEDVAEAVRFLAEAPYVTGAMLPVDGGRHLGVAG